MPSFSDFIRTQFTLKIPKPTESFAGKTVIVTGASSGLGKEAAQHIVRLGASKVILGVRNLTKGKLAKQEIESALRCANNVLEVWQVDIESPPSVKDFVERVNQLPRLDVVLSNAGMQTIRYQVSYGTERTLAVNVIGTLLLAIQLIPKLKETARTYNVLPHLTFTGSALYDVAQFPKNDDKDLFGYFADRSHVRMMDQNQYNLSKLLLLFVVIKLAEIVDPESSGNSKNFKPIVINTLDPCFCKTNLADELTGGFKVVFKIFEFMFARPAEEGSRLLVKATTAGRGTHGRYMRAGFLQEYHSVITSGQGVERREYTWKQVGKKLEELQPGVLTALSVA